MPKFTLIHSIGAGYSEDVEAENAEEALNNSDVYPSLCHQCSREIDLGDTYMSTVLDEDGEEVYIEKSWEQSRIESLEKENAQLIEKIKELETESINEGQY